PFVGGGALFFALGRRPALLSDANAELMEAYRAVRDQVEAVIAALQAHVYDAHHYYRVRALDPARLAPAERAARTIYLNRAGYNGLYRVNRAGRFNVPFGRQLNPSLCDAANLRACAAALDGVELQAVDFEEAVADAAAGDLVYFDPPYVPASETAAFTSYVAAGFDARQHARLARVFRRLTARGVHVVLSNSDRPLVWELYPGFAIRQVAAPRYINSDPARRGAVMELLVCNQAAADAPWS